MEHLPLNECRAMQEHALQRTLILSIFSGNTYMTLSTGREKDVSIITRKPKMQHFRTFFSFPQPIPEELNHFSFCSNLYNEQETICGEFCSMLCTRNNCDSCKLGNFTDCSLILTLFLYFISLSTFSLSQTESKLCHLACNNYLVGATDIQRKSGRGRETRGNQFSFQRTINFSLVWYY